MMDEPNVGGSGGKPWVGLNQHKAIIKKISPRTIGFHFEVCGQRFSVSLMADVNVVEWAVNHLGEMVSIQVKGNKVVWMTIVPFEEQTKDD